MSLRQRVLDRLLPARIDAVEPQLPAPPRNGHQPSFEERVLERADSMINQLTGLGSGFDKGAIARPNLNRVKLTPSELSASYVFNGIAKRIVDLPPDEATRAGWRIIDGSDDTDAVADEDKRLMTQHQTNLGLKRGRLYGDSIVVIVTTDDIPPEFQEPGRIQDWPAQPLELDRVIRVESLVVFDGQEAWPIKYEGDIRQQNYREPSVWGLAPIGRTGPTNAPRAIHASRVMRFSGNILPHSLRFGGFGFSPAGDTSLTDNDSVLQVVYEEVRNLISTMQGGATLAQELRESVVKIKGMGGNTTSDQAALFTMRMRLMARAKALLGLVVLDEDDTYENRSNPPTGFGELTAPMQAMLSAVTGIPQTILFGTTPAGLSTDDESGRQTFDRMINAFRETELRTQLEWFYTVLLASKEGPFQGRPPEDWRLEFAPLDEPTAEERAALRKTVMETDIGYINAGVLDPRLVTRSRFGPDGYQEELLPADDVAVGEEEAARALEERLNKALAEQDPLQIEEAEEVEPDEGRGDQASEAVWLALFPTTETALARIALARGAAEAALGMPLASPPEPHVTLLFVGPVEGASLGVLVDEARIAVAKVPGPIGLRPTGVDSMPMGPNGRTAIVLKLEGFGLDELHVRLLRALAPLISAGQFPEFIPHLTLGSVEGEADRAALAEIELSDLEGFEMFSTIAAVDQVSVRQGTQKVVRLPLGRRDEEDAHEEEEE